jgi:hypothetical protein
VIKGIAHDDAPAVQVAAIDEIDVGPSIAVEVGDTEPRTGLLQNGGRPVGAFLMNELNARRQRGVGELNRRPTRLRESKCDRAE